MEIRDSYPIINSILTACWQLLKNIQIAKLQIVSGRCLIVEAKKESVLIEIIVDNFFSKIYVDFIIHYKSKGSRCEGIFAYSRGK